MSPEEKQVRKILDFALQAHTSVWIAADFLRIHPRITDTECVSIAKGYPYSVVDLQQWFGQIKPH